MSTASAHEGVGARDGDVEYSPAPSGECDASRLSPAVASQGQGGDDDDDDDISWSLYSNAFFVTGGILYLSATVWDFTIFSSDPNVDLHSAFESGKYFSYQLLWFMVPIVYLWNSVIDVRWALRMRKRDKRRRQLERLLLSETRGEDENNPIIEPGPDRRKRRRLRIKNALLRMRKHIGHRRELAAAAAFGAAAMLDVLGTACGWAAVDANLGDAAEEGVRAWGEQFAGASIHVYLLSAIFALWWSPSEEERLCAAEDAAPRAPWHSNVESLETMGDVIFGVASVMDVCLQDVSFDDENFWWPILSAILWTTDALLYLRGDFVGLYLRSAAEKEGSLLQLEMAEIESQGFPGLESPASSLSGGVEGSQIV